MSEEWLDQLITDAQEILKKPVISHNINSIQGDTLEDRCSLLLQGFSQSAEIRFLEGVCRLTWPLFSWFVKRRSTELGLSFEDSRITDRAYGLLSEAALRPDMQVPTDYLFKWCFALMENLLEVERRQLSDNHPGDEDRSLQALYPSNSEVWLRESHSSYAERIETKIIEVLLTGDANLSSIEKEVLTLYYRETELKSLAMKLNIKEDQARSHLKTGRIKVLKVLNQNEKGRLWRVAEEEEQP